MHLLRPSRLAAVATALMSAIALAAEPPLLAIKAGRLVDVEAGRVLTDQVLLVQGEKIKRLGAASQVAIPAGAQVIDLSRSTVMPGLIDVHTHLTVDARQQGYSQLGISDTRAALYGVRAAKLTLLAGFTTVRNVGASGFGDVALRDAINDGDFIGPRMQVSAYSLGIQGGHCDDNLLPAEYKFTGRGVADGPWAARAKVREMVKYGADLIKICATGGVLSKGDTPGALQYTPEEMVAIVQEAHKLGRKVAAHAHGASGITEAIKAGVDSVEHVSLIDDEGIKLALAQGTYLVFDIYNDDYILSEGEKAGMLPESIEKERQIGQAQRESFAKAWKAGTTMAFGSDSGVYPHGDNGKQFAYMVKYGMTPMQAIQAATIKAAKLMAWDDRVGSLKAGKFADIIAVHQDPLADVSRLTSIDFVMKGGEVVKASSAKR